MVTEPKIDKEALKEFLTQEYSLEITDMNFIPRGECSWGYKLITKDQQYFLKIYATKDVPEEAFHLTYDLFEKCGVAHIVHPLKTNNGRVRSMFQDNSVAVFNYIEGIVSDETDLNEQQFEQLGILMARIHQSVKFLGPLQKKDEFELWDQDYVRVMKSLDNSEDIYVQQMIEVLIKNRSRIEKEYAELKEIQKIVKQQDIEFVNCHGDPTPSNIMLTPTGEVYLIDWDDPVSAPKEKDLVFLHHRSPGVMKGYSSITGSSDLNSHLIRYYEHLWNIHEIGGYGTLILDSGSESEKQRQYHLDGLRHALKDMGIQL